MIRALLLTLLSLSAIAQASSRHSSDGQARPQAWFLEIGYRHDARVTVCVKAPSEVERKDIEGHAWSALQGWSRYIQISVWSWITDAEKQNRLNAWPASFYDLRHDCRGDENLTVYYGVEDERVRAAKGLYDDPLAFAHLESYDEQLGRGRGLVWVAKAPETEFHPYHRAAILFHEIGHVFGNEHVSGTIMDESLPERLAAAYRSGKPLTPEGPRSTMGEPLSDAWINLDRELVTWKAVDFSQSIQKGQIAEGSELQSALQLLANEKLTGAYELRFEERAFWKDEIPHNYTDKGKGELTVKAGRCWNPRFFNNGIPIADCERRFKVEFGSRFWLPTGEQKLFRRVFRGRELYEPLRALIQPGAIELGRGRRVNFTITRNANQRFELHLLKGAEKLRLF